LIRLRHATVVDLPLLREWNDLPHVKTATGNEGALPGEHDWMAEWFPPLKGWLEMLIAELDGRPIGVVQIIDPAADETHYWGEVENGLRALDIWLGSPADMGKGHGSEIMQQVIARCFAESEVDAILLDPLAENTRAHIFYERLGFLPIGRQMFGEDDCLVYRLDRAKAKLRVS
jgi:aminoglycoside 6'-N-acetyltransferase